MNAGLIFFRMTRYLKYLIVSKNRKGHGIHSPFVFDLVSRVFRNKTAPAIVYTIEEARNRLLDDKRSIVTRDFGAAAYGNAEQLRKISGIARHSAIPKRYALLLANMAAEFGRPLIVEFGTSFGISTMYLASACTDARVLTMEGCPASGEIARRNFNEAGLKNIELMIGPFEENLTEITGQKICPGLVFIDGNHRKKPVLEYFEKIADISGNNTVIIIDDINYSEEMEEAWSEIKKNGKISLTIDIYRMGIVFFRKGVIRNDYIIRY
jgi:predicted O-methyltransferase YrrM